MFYCPSHLELHQVWCRKTWAPLFPWDQNLKCMLGQLLGIKTEFLWGAQILLSVAKQQLLKYCALVEASVIRASQSVKTT